MRSIVFFALLCAASTAALAQTPPPKEGFWSKVKRITKEEAGNATGMASSPTTMPDGRPLTHLRDTKLADVFNRESGKGGFPRVAITITDVSDRITSRGMNPTSPVAPNDCLYFDAVLWHTVAKSESIEDLVYCASDGLKTFMRGSFNGNFYIASTTEKNTGARRTAGPWPPANLYPRSAEEDELMDGPGYALLGNVLMAMGFDFTYAGDQGRVWVVSVANKPGT